MTLDRIADAARRRWRRRTAELVTLADRARDAREWKEAARRYREALDRAPDDAAIWVQYGHALKEFGELRDPDQLAQAEVAYRKALSLDPGAADTYLQLGHALKLQGKTEEAQSAYLRTFALDPAEPHPVNELRALGWSEAQQVELLRLVLGNGDAEDGAAQMRPPHIVSAGATPNLNPPVSDLHQVTPHAAYSISRIDAHSLLTRYVVSRDGAVCDSSLQAELHDQTAGMTGFDSAAGARDARVPPAAEPELLNAVILAQRWDLDGVKEQLDAVLAERHQLKARITALQAELHYLRQSCVPEAAGPHQQANERTSSGCTVSIDQAFCSLFQPDYYLAQAAARGLSVSDPLTHFDEIGGILGLSPHPLFDSAYYLGSNPDVKSAGGNPLRHYLLHGDQENRNPHRLFNTSYYKSRASISSSDNGLLHYIRIGGRSVDPHECFDTAYYLSRIGSTIPSEMSALEFYLTDNYGMSVSPHPLFDPAYYATQLAERVQDGHPLLLHYLAQSANEAASPHPLFDLAFFHDGEGYSRPALSFYLSNFWAVTSGGYQLHKMQFPEANPYFCSISYLLDHPDLLNGSEVPLVHFAKQGTSARRTSGVDHSQDDEAQLEKEKGADGYDPIRYVKGELIDFARGQANRVAYLDRHNEIFSCGTDGDANLAALFEHTAPWATLRLRNERLVGVATERRRLAIYAVFVPDGRLKTYHKLMLRALREARYATVMVNSTVAGADGLLEQVGELAEGVIVRRGQGRDFASWVIALTHVAPALENVDHVLLLNDSLIGPFGNLAPVIKSMEDDAADFKGLTESNEIAHHLQSSLLMLSRNAVFSGPFLTFLLRFLPGLTRKQVIEDGEVGLSQRMIAAGVATSAQAPHTMIIQSWLEQFPEYVAWARSLPDQLEKTGLYRLFGREVASRFACYLEEWLFAMHPHIWSSGVLNPQQICWEPLLRHGSFPFLKKELATSNPLRIPTLVRICELFPPGQRFEAAALLRDLAQVAEGFPHSYLRLSPALIEAVAN
jgi:hypothetical protein